MMMRNQAKQKLSSIGTHLRLKRLSTPRPSRASLTSSITTSTLLGDYDDAEQQIHDSWHSCLNDEFQKDYMKALKSKLRAEQGNGKVIYPASSLVYKALELCPADQVRVVIVGQDPYHAPGQAEGLAFSVPHNVAIPSSLKNIYKELSSDIPGFRKPDHGNLLQWAKQGVLLLNATLTVEARAANSHKDLGWDTFTNHILRSVMNVKANDPLVFLLWGKFAQQKARQVGLFDKKRSNFLVLEAAHPSGLSAHRGFFGCKHFSKTNQFLEQHGATPINWQV